MDVLTHRITAEAAAATYDWKHQGDWVATPTLTPEDVFDSAEADSDALEFSLTLK